MTNTLLDYLKPDTLEALREKRRHLEAAEATFDRLVLKRREVERALAGNAHQADRQRAAAAVAKLLGEEPVPLPPDAPVGDLSVVELGQALTGLERRIQDAETNCTHARADYRRAASEALFSPGAVDAVSAEYLEAAERLRAAWVQLNVVGDLAGEVQGYTSSLGTLSRSLHTLSVPGLEDRKAAPALARASTMTQAGPLVLSGDTARGDVTRSMRALREETVKTLGRWPWER